MQWAVYVEYVCEGYKMDDLLTSYTVYVEYVCQGYKMDDLLTSYISLMLATMNKQRTMTLRRR